MIGFSPYILSFLFAFFIFVRCRRLLLSLRFIDSTHALLSVIRLYISLLYKLMSASLVQLSLIWASLFYLFACSLSCIRGSGEQSRLFDFDKRVLYIDKLVILASNESHNIDFAFVACASPASLLVPKTGVARVINE